MNAPAFLWAVFIACTFSAWPILGSYARISGGWMCSLILIGSLLAMLPFSGKEMLAQGVPPLRALVIMGGISVLNGMATWAYSAKAADKNISTGIFVVVVAVIMVIAAPILDWAIKKAQPSSSQMIGLLLAPLVIYLLGRK